MKRLSDRQLEVLAKIDSPTVSNAIEALDVRDPTSGYASMELRCQTSGIGPMVGYALTCTADSTSPGPRRQTKEAELLDAVLAAPKPTVVVIKDLGPSRLRSCHAGDVLCSVFQRLGAVALVTDGGVRDIDGIKQRVHGFQVFSAGLVVSHGIPTFLEVGVTVSICGLSIRPGDLLHGDENGLLVIPSEIAGRVADQAKLVWERERSLLDFMNSDAFSLEGLKHRMYRQDDR